MPIYSYKCEDCGEEFDLLVGVTADSEKLICKKCSSENLKRIYSAFGVGKNVPNNSSACAGST
jgi:putative FmdB family regulatory protein